MLISNQTAGAQKLTLSGPVFIFSLGEMPDHVIPLGF